MMPKFTFNKIKYATDSATFKKALGLYESGKVKKFDGNSATCTAKVQGTSLYNVAVSAKNYDYGSCNCYLGEKDILCKHMVAVAIYAIFRGEKINEEEKELIENPRCSNLKSEMDKDELAQIKQNVSRALKLIKAYTGPSRTWFNYQNSLSEGVNRFSAIVSKLPVNVQTSKFLVNLLLKLDKKLVYGGVDDSDGTVGNFIEGVVNVLLEFTKHDSRCIDSFKVLTDIESCFGWEVPLVRLFDEKILND